MMPFRGLTKAKNKKNCSIKTVPEMMLSGQDSPDETALEYEKLSQKKTLIAKIDQLDLTELRRDSCDLDIPD